MEGPKKNPNNIGNIMGFKDGGLPTSPDHVYRSVHGDEAIQDLFEHGEVRNRAEAQGKLDKSRWGSNVYWSRGDGTHHFVGEGSHIIEAPHEIASERAVRADDVTGIYSRNEDGAVENKLEALRERLGIKK
ncbi:MAG TPA: hypothetical protein VGB97_00540 [Candidatus Paceibacterota bacterium]|jgi:hypothetical protein